LYVSLKKFAFEDCDGRAAAAINVTKRPAAVSVTRIQSYPAGPLVRYFRVRVRRVTNSGRLAINLSTFSF
jgi:hypothetical protein